MAEEKPDQEQPQLTSSPQDVHGNDDLQEKGLEVDADDEYPHGWKLVILAGASVIAVFLIALDQVGVHAVLQ